MTRRGQPIDLVVANGRKHLTKEEIQSRKAAEIKLGKKDLDKIKPPAFVKNDAIAYGCWKQNMKEYKDAAEQGIELITTSDVTILSLYCQTYAEYERLLRSYQRIDSIAADMGPLENFIDEDENESRQKAWMYLTNLISIEGHLRIETAINKKMDMLLKMQDRLFLNPLARVKNVLKQPKKDDKKAPSKFAQFGAGRGG
ncbi:P27 family phage terminase small subunit [Paenibacillus alba]|uniref:P27 family phage terminase small subunit n=1 Tax=Paenibacillus alba TaxID=1197127 RepID=UPI001565F00F|nr:P27 family phage terminase small subunit [Paenibacillus alba]NQX68475.1 P27 family phage terminase small subunit [Paenibacillus alba]